MSDDDFDARMESYHDGYEAGFEHAKDETLERIGTVLAQIEPVRQILRLIARQSRDEVSRDEAEKALRLLEVLDGSL